MTTFFTSDYHFGHQNIIKYCNRPWHSAYEMDHDLKKLWNETVQPHDEVYFLGDFAMNKIFVAKFLPELNGEKVLIAGNHDACFKEVYGLSPTYTKTQYYLDAGFKAVLRDLLIPVGKKVVLLNHFPYQQTKAEDARFQELRPIDHGLWLLHGHRHSTPEERLGVGQLDIGCDAWGYKPVSEKQIWEIIG